MIFSCIIPASAKDAESQNLKDLIECIKAQDFPQDQIEILVITEGDSESAKAIGIRRAQGNICAMFCADNYILNPNLFETVHHILSRMDLTGFYTRYYAVVKFDNSLNKYFSLIGNNDPIAFYLGKSDRFPWYDTLGEEITGELVGWPYSNSPLPSLGDNGFFVKRHILLEHANLDHYYPMDAYVDINKKKQLSFFRMNHPSVWHRTSENLISFLKKRYKYARDLYSDRTDRRWKMVDTAQDVRRLAYFVFCTITVIPCLLTSAKGFARVRDYSWFWHWPVCFGFLITYTLLAIRNLLKYGRLFQCPQPSVS